MAESNQDFVERSIQHTAFHNFLNSTTTYYDQEHSVRDCSNGYCTCRWSFGSDAVGLRNCWTCWAYCDQCALFHLKECDLQHPPDRTKSTTNCCSEARIPCMAHRFPTACPWWRFPSYPSCGSSCWHFLSCLRNIDFWEGNVLREKLKLRNLVERVD